jgi:hypothetical protein
MEQNQKGRNQDHPSPVQNQNQSQNRQEECQALQAAQKAKSTKGVAQNLPLSLAALQKAAHSEDPAVQVQNQASLSLQSEHHG